jgi:hypothetical protein
VPFRERDAGDGMDASVPEASSEVDNRRNSTVKQEICIGDCRIIFTHHIYLY